MEILYKFGSPSLVLNVNLVRIENPLAINEIVSILLSHEDSTPFEIFAIQSDLPNHMTPEDAIFLAQNIEIATQGKFKYVPQTLPANELIENHALIVHVGIFDNVKNTLKWNNR